MTAGECLVRILDDGQIYIAQADDEVVFPEEWLGHLDRGCWHPALTYGDGILTLRGVNRTVSYGLGPPDPLRRWRRARRSD